MFGYVRPVREELKCKDFDLYRATYCGLCQTMRRRCGLLAPMVLNFDFTFLAILLAPGEGERLRHRCRCHIPPFRRRCMCEQSAALELAADESVILAYWQLRDKVRDESFVRGLPARSFSTFLYPCYCRAARRQPEFERLVFRQLEKLHRLEDDTCPSIDRTADAFAPLLQGAAPKTGDVGRDRAMEQLLYHLGRWIYLIDAWEDRARDEKSGAYNPFLAAGADKERASFLLYASLSEVEKAYDLLNISYAEGLIENIIYQGCRARTRQVLGGEGV